MAATAIKRRWKRLTTWLWRLLVEPHPDEDHLPQTGPFELYTIIPTLHGGHNGYKLERKIAGMRSYKECEWVANRMGIVDYYVIVNNEGAAVSERSGRRVRVA